MNDIDKYINHCRLFIGDKPSATDEEIQNAVELFSPLFPNVDVDKVKKKLMTLYTLPIKPCKTLVDTLNPGSGWLLRTGKKEKINWSFWERYKTHLRENEKYQPGIIYQLDNITDNILDNLFDPTLTDIEICKKGLVVGQVQSGKTSNFTGLICKAVDAGFNVVIVFAGILDDLRTQTQSRLEKCFLGFTTKNIKNLSEKEILGVGKIDPDPVAHSFTTVLSDFKETTVNSLGANFQTKEPIIFVVKKNARILLNLKYWLSKKERDNKSVLFIDDEADNASVNTSTNLDKASTINQRIREILNLFTRSAYVGYTATPYANIFIDKKDSSDLFPRHFIVNLPTPPAYLSPEKVFGLANDVDEQPLPIVNIVRDYSTFVPDKHKRDDYDCLTYANVPESIKYAIRAFILACAVRCARGQEKKHNSMLLHLSRYQIWQNKIKELIERCFKYYKQEIISDDSSILELFRKTYEEDCVLKYGEQEMHFQSFLKVSDEIKNSNYTIIKEGIDIVSWSKVQSYLYRVVNKIEVKSLNGASTDILAYENNEDDGYYVIAIGGDKLSRGLTLEGLTISYFLRSSKMYDTLMQMGRWFGYRPKYVDVCRLFISDEIENWFKNVTIANNELREEFDYLWETKGSPQQYALKVRTSPGLSVTSPLKMMATKDVQLSWASTLVETYSLIRSRRSKKYNFELTSTFIKDLGEIYKTSKESNNYLWINVPVAKICNYISKFEVPESSRIKMNFKKMVDYIITCSTQYGELQNWRVVIKNVKNRNGARFYFDDPHNLPGFCSERTIVNGNQNPQIYNLKNYRLISGPEDEFIDIHMLGEESIYFNKALEETIRIKKEQHIKNANIKEWDKPYPSPTLVRQNYRPENSPLLIIYPLDPQKANIENTNSNYNLEVYEKNEIPFIGFAIVFPKSKNSQGVKYKVNEIKDLLETEITFESENDNIYTYE